MKQIAKYRIFFDSAWIQGSCVCMGIAIFVQAMYFLAFGGFQQSDGYDRILFCIIPLILEFAWIILLRGIQLKSPGIFGVIAILFCVLLTLQNFRNGSTLQMVIGTVLYLFASGLVFLITGGFFPYKLAGCAIFAGIGLLRLLVFELPGLSGGTDLHTLAQMLPPLCTIASLSLFFAGLYRAEASE